MKLADIQPVLSKAELLQLRSYINKVVIDESLLRYIAQMKSAACVLAGARLISSTRTMSEKTGP